jgi:hypothetical protein
MNVQVHRLLAAKRVISFWTLKRAEARAPERGVYAASAVIVFRVWAAQNEALKAVLNPD